MSDKKGWRELAPGTVMLEPGSSRAVPTGTWRGGRVAHWIEERCIQCLFCWLYCPHFAIDVRDAKVTGENRFYCVGCGICEQVCPTKPKAIVMVREELKLEDEAAEGGQPMVPTAGGESAETDWPVAGAWRKGEPER